MLINNFYVTYVLPVVVVVVVAAYIEHSGLLIVLMGTVTLVIVDPIAITPCAMRGPKFPVFVSVNKSKIETEERTAAVVANSVNNYTSSNNVEYTSKRKIFESIIIISIIAGIE